MSNLRLALTKCINYLHEVTILSAFDGISSYWKIDFDEWNSKKPHLQVTSGIFSLYRYPLKNAPEAFQRAMNSSLVGKVPELALVLEKWKTALVYLKDILMSSGKVKGNMVYVEQILFILNGAEIMLIMKNVVFFSKEINYRGHGTRPGRFKIVEGTTKDI